MAGISAPRHHAFLFADKLDQRDTLSKETLLCGLRACTDNLLLALLVGS